MMVTLARGRVHMDAVVRMCPVLSSEALKLLVLTREALYGHPIVQAALDVVARRPDMTPERSV